MKNFVMVAALAASTAVSAGGPNYQNNNNQWAAGVAGLAAGIVIGAFMTPPPAPNYYPPGGYPAAPYPPAYVQPPVVVPPPVYRCSVVYSDVNGVVYAQRYCY